MIIWSKSYKDGWMDKLSRISFYTKALSLVIKITEGDDVYHRCVRNNMESQYILKVPTHTV